MEKKGLHRRALLTGAVSAGLGILATNVDFARGQPRRGSSSGRSPKKLKPVKTLAEYQVTAAIVAQRVSHDPTFVKELKQDPVKTLQGLGIGNDAVRELIQEDRALEKIGSKRKTPALDCTGVTCICSESGCCFTCWFTDIFETGNPVVHFAAAVPGVKVVSSKRSQLLQNLIEHGHISSPD
jgi:hypothetical protein